MSIFWTRLGTPTGQHESGSVEEIKEHVASGKAAMVYFSSAPIVPGSYDQEQFEKLLSFKNWCEGQGIIRSFTNTKEFEARFKDDLILVLRDNPYLNSLTFSPNPIDTADDIQMRTVSLGELAIDLLVKAANADSGMIMHNRTLGGTSFQAGSQKTSHDGSRKEIARLEAAIEELEQYGLIRDIGHKGELFEVTHEGYQAIDRNKLN